MDNNKVVSCCGKGSVESLVTKFKAFQSSKSINNPFDYAKKFPQTLPQTPTPKSNFDVPQLTSNGALKFSREPKKSS
jgi:hypothetical protein